ncbi:conserved hypothetical protein [Sporisorium reilianum SRZ2]|uniref:Uncharacterized protein n=1 Tax=Sporisorium reilianum (strain SRZ2) TaxID=999809 RepID=E6ZVM9_SPORE|nr:conserved hypothetical protein [Sporisorium reilianum SRZ2]
MAIFGLKSRKSYSSETSSLTKRTSRNHHLEASDVVGDTPEFGQLDRRGPSHTSDSSSLLSRNSTSMKKFFGSTRRKGSQSVDIGSPGQPNTTGNMTSSPSSDYLNNATSKRASRTSLNRPAAAATPIAPPVVTPSAITPSLSTPAGTGNGTSSAQAVESGVSGGLAPSSIPPAAPRPSDLFAGKGVQWEQLDLTSRAIPKSTDAATTSVDMQKFLKERRQWIPTFKEEEQAVEEAASVQLPKSLDQFSFATPAEVTKSSAGLKSLKDLEDSHKRKAALLNETPLASTTNGTIFEEAAGPSTSTSVDGTGSAAAAAAGTATQALPPPPAPPSRNQSFRTSVFAASDDSAVVRPSASLSRKPTNTLGVNGGSASASSPASRDIPQRRSSVRKELSELAAGADAETNDNEPPRPAPANGRVDRIKEQAGISGSTASGSVRPSMDTAGFGTPTGSQSNDGEHAAPTVPSAQQSTLPTQDGSQDSASRPTSPPRPPKNGQRTPSRQSSAEPIRAALSKSPSTNFKPAQEEQAAGNNLVEKLVQAAPALQNVVPGTGAATTHDA